MKLLDTHHQPLLPYEGLLKIDSFSSSKLKNRSAACFVSIDNSVQYIAHTKIKSSSSGEPQKSEFQTIFKMDFCQMMKDELK